MISNVYGLTCNNEKSCYGQDKVIDSSEAIECRGYRSCANSVRLLSIGSQEIQCTGGLSCYGSSLISSNYTSSSNLLCYGTMSCSHVGTLSINSGSILCQGSLSCSFSDIYMGNNKLECNGFRSCMNSYINSNHETYFDGALSAQNSYIYISDSSVIIYFRGANSAKNTTVVCGSGYTCSVECENGACIDNELTLICENGDDYDVCFTSISCSNSLKCDICPNGNEYDYNSHYWMNEDNAFVDLLDYNKIDTDSLSLDVYNNIVNTCGNDVDTCIACGDWYGCADDLLDTTTNNNKSTICCNGVYSCRSATNVTTYVDFSKSNVYNTAFRSDGQLSGENFQNDVIAKNGGNMYFDGYLALGAGASNDARIMTTNEYDIICGGNYACKWGDMAGGKNMYCIGTTSCRDINSISNFDNFWGYGYNSMLGGTVSNINENVYCSAAYACQNVKFNNVGKYVYGFGSYSMASAKISNVDQGIIAVGNYALQSTKIFNTSLVGCVGENCIDSATINNVAMIVINGTNAMNTATITSNRTDNNESDKSMYLCIYGDSGGNHYITCSSGDTCFIYCDEDTSSCRYMNLDCQGTCYVNCGTYCPSMTSGTYSSWNYSCDNIVTSAPTPPSVSPTNVPSNEPSVTPSAIPTDNPSVDPTVIPSNEPSSNPSANPSYPPSIDPTNKPSSDPTTVPSIVPSVTPTPEPSGEPSIGPSIAPTSHPTITNITGNGEFGKEAAIVKEFETAGIVLPIVASSLAVSTCMGAICYHRFASNAQGIDKPIVWLIFRFFSNAGDFWTDIFFTIILFYDSKTEVLGIVSALFTFVPHIGSLIVCLHFISKWKQHKDGRLAMYLSSYEVFIFGATLISGFYSALALCQTNIFYHPLFYMPIKSKEKKKLKHFKFINIVFCENIPQLIIQLWYVMTTASDEITVIVYISMIFSVLSIILSATSQISRVLELFRPTDQHYTKTEVLKGRIRIQSSEFRGIHRFTKKTIEQSLSYTVANCDLIEKLESHIDILCKIEVFYINSIHLIVDKNIEADFDAYLLTNDDAIMRGAASNGNKKNDVARLNDIGSRSRTGTENSKNGSPAPAVVPPTIDENGSVYVDIQGMHSNSTEIGEQDSQITFALCDANGLPNAKGVFLKALKSIGDETSVENRNMIKALASHLGLDESKISLSIKVNYEKTKSKSLANMELMRSISTSDGAITTQTTHNDNDMSRDSNNGTNGAIDAISGNTVDSTDIAITK